MFRLGVLQIGLDFLNHLGILGVREIHFARIHLEGAAEVGTVNILWSQVEVEVREFVAVGCIVDFFGIEGLLHGAGNADNVSHESIALFVAQFVEVVDMILVGDETTAAIGLLLEKESA